MPPRTTRVLPGLLGASLLFHWACQERAEIEIEIDAESAAVIIIVEAPNGRSVAVAEPPEVRGGLSLAVENATNIFVLQYRSSPYELGLHPGTINPPRRGRQLPMGKQILKAQFDADEVTGWETLTLQERWSEWRPDVLLPFINWRKQLADGGCSRPSPDGHGQFVRREICPDPPEVTPPLPPNPVDFGDCPIGWTARSLETASFCEPPQRAGGCVGAMAQFVDSASCESIGEACPPGNWANFTGPNVRYVLLGEPAGGTGTDTDPFGSIGEALEDVSDTTTIALSSGSFVEDLEITSSVRLRGACVAGTRIVGTGAANWIRVRDADVEIGDLTIAPSTGVGNGIDVASGSVRLENLLVEALPGTAIRVRDGGRVIGERVVVRDAGGLAIGVESAGAVELRHFVSKGSGVGVSGEDSSLTLMDAVIENNSTVGAYNVTATSSGTVDLARALLDGRYGARLVEARGQFSDVHIVHRLPSDKSALSITSAELIGERLHIDGGPASTTGASVTGIELGGNSSAQLRDLVVALNDRIGALIVDSGTLDLERGLIIGPAVAIVAARTSGSIRDLHVLNTRDSGISLDEAEFEISRARIEHVQEGLRLFETSTATVGDVEIRTALEGGIVTKKGAFLNIQRASISDMGRNAMVVDDESRVSISDLRIADTSTAARCADLFCRGAILIDAASVVTVRRFAIVDRHKIGVVLRDSRGDVHLSEGQIVDSSVAGAHVELTTEEAYETLGCRDVAPLLDGVTVDASVRLSGEICGF